MRVASELSGGDGLTSAGADPALSRLIQSLECAAREIDVTFARAGSQLGEGLALFEGLKQRLSDLSIELTGSALTDAGATLANLADELREIGGGLRSEGILLADLSHHGHEAAQILERLLEHMRLITILARSARIEAVSVQAIGRDFGDFTQEIVTLTGVARDTIASSVRDHERLAVLLDSALNAQRDFESRYGSALATLADELARTLAEVSSRQRRGAELTRDAAAHSGRIAMAAGGAIIALQSGDSIRQRLEHAIAALRLVLAMQSGADVDLADAERIAAIRVLRRLEAAQLRESAAALGSDADEIEGALALLADDTGALLDLVRSLYRGDEAESGSFLVALEANLGRASDILGRCNTARASVDRVTEALGQVLETCQNTVGALIDTVSNIELIGMNAGLRAARVGTEGRSLVVIAQELKFAADQIARDARGLTPALERMQQAATGLDHGGRLGSGHFVAMGDAMQASLVAMRAAGERLGATLGELLREGGGFGKVIAEARLSFSNAGAMSDLIVSAGNELDRTAQGPEAVPQDMAVRIGEVLQARIWPSYTMAAERVIYQSVTSANGLVAERSVTVAAFAAPVADDLDDLLF